MNVTHQPQSFDVGHHLHLGVSGTMHLNWQCAVISSAAAQVVIYYIKFQWFNGSNTYQDVENHSVGPKMKQLDKKSEAFYSLFLIFQFHVTRVQRKHRVAITLKKNRATIMFSKRTLRSSLLRCFKNKLMKHYLQYRWWRWLTRHQPRSSAAGSERHK